MMNKRLGAVFMPHGLGHFLGLDTHDPGGYLKVYNYNTNLQFNLNLPPLSICVVINSESIIGPCKRLFM